MDDGDREWESCGDSDATLDDGPNLPPKVVTGSNSKVRCDGGLDGVSSDDSDAEAGEDSESMTRELLSRWLKCGHSERALSC